MIRLDGATVLLQWATGGLLFLWVTTRRREVGWSCGLRYAPELHFLADLSLERGARVEEILARVLPPRKDES